MSTNNIHQDRQLDCNRMGDFFMILGHSTRMRIFCALQNGSRSVTRIAEEAEISISNASQHLRLMRDRGAVISERHGQTVFYGIADPRFFQAASLIRDALDDRSKASERNRFSGCAQAPAETDRTVEEFSTESIHHPTTN
ncbi:MAG: metalloregulator ArsR/SmtB family transcription factor [Terriglobia bacterium]|nr:metalloregulator ArsR/SmtB family transcription factor [Terriglobia bacterium]